MYRSDCIVLSLLSVAVIVCRSSISTDADEELSQAGLTNWGSDHVGQPLPDYITGDECLFCHRRDIGPAWTGNSHQRTLRRATRDDPTVSTLKDQYKEIDTPDFLLGSKQLTRFLRKSKEYGKLDLLSVMLRPHAGDNHGDVRANTSTTWDTTTFADRCAGCHSTAVDTVSGAFSATSLDCFTCHGDVDLAHTNNTDHIFLSKTNQDPRKVVSTCGQCHLRGGQSRTTGRPYPNTFVPGDNLFHDFDVDLSDATIEALPAMEQHIYLNCRNVATGADESVTCLSCHSVHKQSTKTHQQLEPSYRCNSCHDANMQLIEALQPANLMETHNKTCDY
jgi:hypothetical protein